MRRTIFLAFLLGASLNGTATAGVEVGSKAPALVGKTWLNFDNFTGKTLGELRGSAVFLEYWQTW